MRVQLAGTTFDFNLRDNLYELDATRFFFVDKFYETDFKKITPRAPMGSLVFDLTRILETEKLLGTQKIAELLNANTCRFSVHFTFGNR